MERLELVLVHRGENDRRSYWRDQAGRLQMSRAAGEELWTARLDREPVQVVHADGTVSALGARTAEDLADLLVLETGVQAVFDDEGHWREDVTGWPVRVERPPRPRASC